MPSKLKEFIARFIALAFIFMVLWSMLFGWGWFVPYALQPSYWEAQRLANIQDYKGYKYYPEKEQIYNQMLSYFGYKNFDELFEVEPRKNKNKSRESYFLQKSLNDRIVIIFSLYFLPNSERKRENIERIDWTIIWYSNRNSIKLDICAGLICGILMPKGKEYISSEGVKND